MGKIYTWACLLVAIALPVHAQVYWPPDSHPERLSIPDGPLPPDNFGATSSNRIVVPMRPTSSTDQTDVLDESFMITGPNGYSGCDDCGVAFEDRCYWFPRRYCYMDGLGTERVMFAPLEIETTQPMNNIRLRTDFAKALDFPDRSEFFWAKTKAPERTVSHQDLILMIERGGERFSTQLHIPLRILDPEINANTAGLGDLILGNKLLIMDGKRLQLSGILRTHILTGSKNRGLGTGHISLEPGLLGRCMMSPWAFLHAESRLWIPIAGDPTHSGQVLRYGAGLSYVLMDSPDFAVMPTLEFVGYSFLAGQRSGAGAVATTNVDGDHIGMFYPGLRFTKDTNGDLGIAEFGIAAGIPFQSRRYYDSLLRLELRFTF